MFFLFAIAVIIIVIVIAIVIRANIRYRHDLRNMTPEQRVNYKREETDDLQIW